MWASIAAKKPPGPAVVAEEKSSPPPPPLPPVEPVNKIRQQVEYYFSDSNWVRDTYLRSLVVDGVVPYEDLLDFPRLKGIDEASLRNALVGSGIVSTTPRGIARQTRKCRHFVLDANSLISADSLAWLVEMNAYTTPGVLAEVRDRASRQRLAALPFQLASANPSKRALDLVTAFARHSGDLRSLSPVDIQIIALTYDIELKQAGTDAHLTKLNANRAIQATRGSDEAREDRSAHEQEETQKSTAALPEEEKIDEVSTLAEEDDDVAQEREASSDCSSVSSSEDAEVRANPAPARKEEEKSRILNQHGLVSVGDADEDDGIGWEGPTDSSGFGEGDDEEDRLQSVCAAACLTADFAMQNVLMHMGLRVLSMDGRRVQARKRFVARCSACFYVEKENVDRAFCGRCGSHALRKTVMRPDGTVRTRHAVAKRRPQGSKFPLPMPKNGEKKGAKRFEGDILLREDQLLQGIWKQRKARGEAQAKKDATKSVFGPDVAEALADLDIKPTKAAYTVGYGRTNPNAIKGRERRGKKKRR